MKKRLVKLLYVGLWIVLFAGLFSAILDLKNEVQTFVRESNNCIVEEKYSPNGRLKAVKFERNMGATTSINYQLSIISANGELGNDTGNVYGSETSFDFEWSGNKTLIIKNNSDDSVFKRESRFMGIEILYEQKT